METLTLTKREQARLQVLNSLLAEHMNTDQAATLMGLSARHTRRLLAAYRESGAAANWTRKPRFATISRTHCCARIEIVMTSQTIARRRRPQGVHPKRTGRELATEKLPEYLEADEADAIIWAGID